MGRGKLNMELICNERSRMITYHKRKKGLTKKAREFQILCGVDACVIIFGPDLNNRPVDVETWPTDSIEVRRIINRFRSEGTDRKKTQDLSHFFEARKKRLDDEIVKLRKACVEAKFPAWDNRLNFLSVDQLRVLAGVFEAKLDIAKGRIMKLKGNPFLMEDSKSGITAAGSISNKSSLMVSSNFTNALLPQNIELEALNQQPLSYAKSIDMPLATYYSSDQLQQMPINGPMLLMMNHEDFGQFGGISSNNTVRSTVHYNYDPATEMIGNTMFNNPRAHSVSYYGPSRQPNFSYWQNPMMQNVPSQMRFPQLSDFYDVHEFFNGKKEKKVVSTPLL
ncbi:unnamed protein product [Dovyalis caffra]|uniref:MADS-box domain-containing protein n=1 Tax=Dovyalis caffra TaxID=77055 RepID=A0AAV1RAR3_9ROSI|nr:unnamed protein product [Dovyalis caffra]